MIYGKIKLWTTTLGPNKLEPTKVRIFEETGKYRNLALLV
jgi:hypothetical protein